MLSSWKYQSRFENTSWLTTWILPIVLPCGAGSTRRPRLVMASSTDSCSRRPSAGLAPSGALSAACAGAAAHQSAAARTSAGRKKRLGLRTLFTRGITIADLRSSRVIARPGVSLSFWSRVQVSQAEEGGAMHVRLDELRGRKVFDANG